MRESQAGTRQDKARRDECEARQGKAARFGVNRSGPTRGEVCGVIVVQAFARGMSCICGSGDVLRCGVEIWGGFAAMPRGGSVPMGSATAEANRPRQDARLW